MPSIDRGAGRGAGLSALAGAAAPADGGLLRVDGERNIAAALRCFAGQPTAVVALIGIQIEN